MGNPFLLLLLWTLTELVSPCSTHALLLNAHVRTILWTPRSPHTHSNTHTRTSSLGENILGEPLQKQIRTETQNGENCILC